MDTRRVSQDYTPIGEVDADEAANNLGWWVLDNPDELIPLNDIYDHKEGPECSCRPFITVDDILLHNSFDGRERREWGYKDH